MNKININLSPKQNQWLAFIQKLLVFQPLLNLSAVFIFALILALHFFALLQAASLGAAERKWPQWQEKANIIKKIKDETAALEAKRKELEKAAAPKHMAAQTMADIFASLPANIWLDKLSLKDGQLSIDGYIVEQKQDKEFSLSAFINALKSQKHFSAQFGQLALKESQETDFNGVKVLKFALECKN